MGAQLHSAEPGLDQDEFDAYCDHSWCATQARWSGTYRILAPEAHAAPRLLFRAEFDLARLARSAADRRARPLLHRARVPHRRRDRAAVVGNRALRARARLRVPRRLRLDERRRRRRRRRALYDGLKPESLAPREYRVFPKRALPMWGIESPRRAAPAPLLKG